MKLGTATVTAIYLGTTSIVSAYLGATQVFGGASAFTPLDLFSTGSQGIWLDPSDLSTMFSDRAGTTAVTTPGTTVGLRLDKSKGLALGAELVVNGTFDSGTTGWTPQSLTTISVEDGQLKAVSSAAADTGVWQALTTAIGKTYRITASLRGTAGQLNIAAYNGAFSTLLAQNTNYPETGVLTEGSLVFTAIGTQTRIIISPGGTATTYYADNISVRELAGNHAVAPTDAARPIYGVEPKGGRRNLLTYSEQFDNAVWNKIAGGINTVTANTIIAPDGTLTADTLSFASGADKWLGYEPDITLVSGQTYTFSVWVRRLSGSSQIRLNVNPYALSWADVTVTSEWTRVSVTQTSATTTTPAQTCGILAANSSSDQIYIWGAQLELGSTATNYQRVTTAYDITESGVATCHYVQYDGSDDSMSTAAIDFTATDKMSVFAGVRKLSDAAAAFVAEFSASVNTNNGSFGLIASQNNGATYDFVSKGAFLRSAITPTLYPAPISNVLTGLGDISGDRVTLRVDGVQAGQSTLDQGTGNYGNYPLFIGRRNNGVPAPGLPFNGRDYGIIIVGKAASAGEITNTETWLAAKTAQVTI